MASGATLRDLAEAHSEGVRVRARDKIAAGELAAVRIGSGSRAPIRIDADALDAWLEALHLEKK
jgi:hypothetical protein